MGVGEPSLFWGLNRKSSTISFPFVITRNQKLWIIIYGLSYFGVILIQPRHFSELWNFGKLKKNTGRGARIRNAPYKKHLGKIGDFDGGLFKKHFQNWQFEFLVYFRTKRPKKRQKGYISSALKFQLLKNWPWVMVLVKNFAPGGEILWNRKFNSWF